MPTERVPVDDDWQPFRMPKNHYNPSTDDSGLPRNPDRTPWVPPDFVRRKRDQPDTDLPLYDYLPEYDPRGDPDKTEREGPNKPKRGIEIIYYEAG